MLIQTQCWHLTYMLPEHSEEYSLLLVKHVLYDMGRTQLYRMMLTWRLLTLLDAKQCMAPCYLSAASMRRSYSLLYFWTLLTMSLNL